MKYLYPTLLTLLLSCNSHTDTVIVEKENKESVSVSESEKQTIDTQNKEVSETDRPETKSGKIQASQNQKKKSEEQNIGLIREERNNEFIQTAPEPSIEATVKTIGDSLCFVYIVDQPGNPAIGCSNYRTQTEIRIKKTDKDFFFSGKDLEMVNIRYILEGGLTQHDGKETMLGYMRGIKNADGSWKIDLNTELDVFDYVNERRFKEKKVIKAVFQ